MMKEVAGYAKIGLIDPNGSATDINNVYVTNPTTATTQRISTAGQSQNDNNRVSSRFVEDGSYLRLKSISMVTSRTCLPSQVTTAMIRKLVLAVRV